MKRVLPSILLLATILISINVTAYEFCDDGVIGEDMLRIISVDDMEKENSVEWIWQSEQEIEVEVRVENRDDNSGTYIVELAFIDTDSQEDVAEDNDYLEQEITLEANERKSLSFEFLTDDDVDDGEYELHVKLYKKGDENEQCVENSEEVVQVKRIEICDDGNVDEDRLKISSITDESDLDDDWEWAPGNQIEIEVTAANRYYEDEDYIVELLLLDKYGDEVVLTSDSEEIKKSVTLEEDESDDVIFEFDLSSELPEGDYYLYAKIYQEGDSDKCTSLKAQTSSNPKTIKINREENNVIVKSVTGPTELIPGGEATYTATIINLGEDDEDKVNVIAYSYYLDLNSQQEVLNLESGKEAEVTFNIVIPTNASNLTKRITFSTEFEYNEDKDYYKESSREEDDLKYSVEIVTKEEEIVEETTDVVEGTTEETEQTEVVEEETTEDSTNVITGNVVNEEGESSSSGFVWGILGLVVLAGIGLYFMKRNSQKKPHSFESPVVKRRYVASI